MSQSTVYVSVWFVILHQHEGSQTKVVHIYNWHNFGRKSSGTCCTQLVLKGNEWVDNKFTTSGPSLCLLSLFVCTYIAVSH